MKKVTVLLQLSMMLLLGILVGCNPPEEAVKPTIPKLDSQKSITSFSLTGVSPAITGSINATSNTITLTVPNALDLNALIPTIQISEKATIIPASGLAQNFNKEVKYTVTAEDGSSTDYVVKVSVDPTVSFTLDPVIFGIFEVQQDNVLIIKGSNFGDDASKIKVIFENISDSDTVGTVVALFSSTTIISKIPFDAPLGTYKVKVIINNQQKYMAENFKMVYHAPSVESISPLEIEKGKNITVMGNYFAESGNILKISLNNVEVKLTIVSESKTKIVATIPSTVSAGDYTLGVTSNGKTSYFNENKISVKNPASTPVITSISKTSYNVGEIFTINGTKLGKDGAISNINFMPFNGGATIIRSAIPNADGTQLTYTLPANFTTGTYVIVVEVDFEFSEEYTDVIQIK